MLATLTTHTSHPLLCGNTTFRIAWTLSGTMVIYCAFLLYELFMGCLGVLGFLDTSGYSFARFGRLFVSDVCSFRTIAPYRRLFVSEVLVIIYLNFHGNIASACAR